MFDELEYELPSELFRQYNHLFKPIFKPVDNEWEILSYNFICGCDDFGNPITASESFGFKICPIEDNKFYTLVEKEKNDFIRVFRKLDTNAMRSKCKPFAEELTAYVFHPVRMQNMSNLYGYELDEYMEYFM
jgi:hypothetical protein